LNVVRWQTWPFHRLNLKQEEICSNEHLYMEQILRLTNRHPGSSSSAAELND
jgi:hypothetical protein